MMIAPMRSQRSLNQELGLKAELDHPVRTKAEAKVGAVVAEIEVEGAGHAVEVVGQGAERKDLGVEVIDHVAEVGDPLADQNPHIEVLGDIGGHEAEKGAIEDPEVETGGGEGREVVVVEDGQEVEEGAMRETELEADRREKEARVQEV